MELLLLRNIWYLSIYLSINLTTYLSNHLSIYQVKRKGSSQTDTFDKKHYYSSPNEYEGIFHTKVLPYITTLINGIYIFIYLFIYLMLLYN
jgi:hypothetical protein